MAGKILNYLVSFINGSNYNKLSIYNEFKDYLKETYPDKDFKLNWVKFDILNNRFYADVLCTTDGSRLSLRKEKGGISEEFIATPASMDMKKMVYYFLEKSGFRDYVDNISVSREGIDNFRSNSNSPVMFRNNVYIYYSERVTDLNTFSKVSYSILQLLRRNKINLDYIVFTHKVYELRLNSEIIKKELSENEVFEFIYEL